MSDEPALDAHASSIGRRASLLRRCRAARCRSCVGNYRVFQLTLVLAYSIALLGLNMLTGYNGQISLGHGAFYAIGAYTAAILMDKVGLPYWATIPIAGAVCFVVGFLFGLPALRLEGLYLALATFALGVAMPQILKHKSIEHWTGGVQGIVIVKPDAPGVDRRCRRTSGSTSSRWPGSSCCSSSRWNLLRGRIGRAMVAIRDQPIAAQAMGVNTALVKSLTFGVSALYTGVAGALGAIAIQFVAPDSFNIFLSITLLVGVVIGGLASISGAFFGALFIQFIPNVADQISKAAPWAIYGVVLIAFMYVDADRRRRVSCAWRGRGWRGGAPPRARVDPTRSFIQHGARHEPRPSFASAAAPRSAPALGAAVAGQNACAQAAKYGPGASATEIKLGQTMPYSGPASAYGTIGKVQQAYFKMINDNGGINGRKINLISLDDGYSPPKTVEQVRRLVEQDEVLALFQTLGTPSNSAIHKYVNAKKVPHLLLATGATKWGDPKNFPWTMGFNLSYQSEGADLRQVAAEEQAEREDRDPLPERRLRQGRAEGRQGRPRRGRARR